ncbi:MAG: TIGR02266 family protein [Polyangiaceae bacterium]
MSQDTRKDPRAKIVSLNVRYKSATVDEFIDNHASDVSKGGIFIKTSTPFPQGTLLKFEIRLAGDQSVIAGVGRVVWKRETGAAGAGPDRAAGMGVKFIKLDDASRAVIDKLTASRENAGSAFTSELENDVTQVDTKAPTGMTGAAALKSTIAGVGPSAKPTIQGMPAQSAPPRPAAGIKSTIVGMPAVQAPKDDAKSGGGFFPAGSGSEADMPPPAERTVMKQAAELLEEALKEAGGSMDEVGTNPLFEKSAQPPPAAVTAKVDPADAPTLANEMPKPSPEEKKAVPTETAKLPRPITSQPILASDRAHSLSSSRPASVSAKSYVEEPAERKSSPLPFVLLGLVVIGVGGFGAYRAGLFGGSAPVDTSPMPTPSVTASATPMDSAMAMTDASLAAIPETADGGGLAGALAAKDAGAPMPSVSATVKPPVVTYHPPKPHPSATATSTETPIDTSAPTSTSTGPTPAPTDTPSLPTPTAAPTTTAVPTATGSTTHGTKPPDDNPY